jgi:hypothetical protein
MVEFQIPQETYYDRVYSLLVSDSTDMAEKCELLEEALEPMDSAKVEQFVRQVLELLDQKTIDSLLDPESHSQGISKKKRTAKPAFVKESSTPELTKSIDTLSIQETDNDIPEGVDHLNSLSPLELLQNIFTSVSAERLQTVLESTNYSIEDAMDVLLNGNQEDSRKPKQICRHFMLGNCYRSDCWFSHDPDALICKFWLKGRCYKGDNCEFSHGQVLEVPTPPTPSPPAQPQIPPKMDDFPVLGVSKKSSNGIDFLSPTSPYNTVAKKPPEKTKMDRYISQKNTENSRKSLAKVDANWLSTGDSLASSYYRYRSDAIDVAINRNKLFQRYNALTLERQKRICLETRQQQGLSHSQLKS